MRSDSLSVAILFCIAILAGLFVAVVLIGADGLRRSGTNGYVCTSYVSKPAPSAKGP